MPTITHDGKDLHFAYNFSQYWTRIRVKNPGRGLTRDPTRTQIADPVTRWPVRPGSISAARTITSQNRTPTASQPCPCRPNPIRAPADAATAAVAAAAAGQPIGPRRAPSPPPAKLSAIVHRRVQSATGCSARRSSVSCAPLNSLSGWRAHAATYTEPTEIGTEAVIRRWVHCAAADGPDRQADAAIILQNVVLFRCTSTPCLRSLRSNR